MEGLFQTGFGMRNAGRAKFPCGDWHKRLSAVALFSALCASAFAGDFFGTINRDAASDAAGIDDFYPAIDCDDSGRSVAAWIRAAPTYPGSGNSPQLVTARSEDGRTSWSAPVSHVILNYSYGVDRPAIAVNGSGKWALLWSEGFHMEIRCSVSSDLGRHWTPPATISATGSVVSRAPRIAYNSASDQWLAVWQTTQAGQTKVFYSVAEGDPTSWSQPQRLTRPRPDPDIYNDAVPEAIADSSGGFLVFWHEMPADVEVVARVGGSGAPVASFPSLRPLYDGPPIANEGSGRFVAAITVFNSVVSYGNTSDIAVWKSSDNGVNWTEETRLTAGGLFPGNSGPAIAADQKGNVAVAWQEVPVIESIVQIPTRLFISRSFDHGETWTTASQIPPQLPAIEFPADPILRFDRFGDWALVWADRSRTNSVYGGDEDLFQMTVNPPLAAAERRWLMFP